MSKLGIPRESVPKIILHTGFIIAILIIASAIFSAAAALPLTLDTYRAFYRARETAMYGLVVALEALVGSYLTQTAITGLGKKG